MGCCLRRPVLLPMPLPARLPPPFPGLWAQFTRGGGHGELRVDISDGDTFVARLRPYPCAGVARLLEIAGVPDIDLGRMKELYDAEDGEAHAEHARSMSLRACPIIFPPSALWARRYVSAKPDSLRQRWPYLEVWHGKQFLCELSPDGRWDQTKKFLDRIGVIFPVDADKHLWERDWDPIRV